MKIVFFLAVFVLIINFLNIDFNQILSYSINKIAFINIIVSFIIILITYKTNNIVYSYI
jgi:hypothetical protein